MDAEFLIIGGGIAGVSAAARLAPHGRVIVLEAEANLAHHASGRSAALYEPRYGLPAVVELSLASGDYFRSIKDMLTPRGLMILGRADQADAFAHDIATMHLDRISMDEARAIVPILNPAIAKDGAGWRVTTATGSYTAATLINAAGAWVDEVAALAGIKPLGFQPNRRSMARIPAPGGHDVSGWPMMFGCGETWYAKPDAGALIVSPAEEHPMAPHDAWAEDMVLAEGLSRYEEMVTEPVTRLISNWAGLRTFSPDRVLVIGRDARDPSFFWLAGQGGYGFQSAPGASQLAADLLTGTAPALSADLIAALSPARFG